MDGRTAMAADERGMIVSAGEANRPDTRLLALSGHLDGESQLDVVSHIEAHRQHGATRIILDFTHVSYVTSAGFAALVEQWHKARAAGGDLVVLDPPPHLQVLLRVLQQTADLPIVRSMADAYAHLDRLAAVPDALPADESSSTRPAPLPPTPPPPPA